MATNRYFGVDNLLTPQNHGYRNLMTCYCAKK